MIITEKMIRELQRRVDITYEEAERFLRRAGGNIDIAETYANKKANSLGNRLFREFEKIINATLIYRIRVYKGEDQFLNVPILTFLIILFLIGVDKSLLLGVVFVILALIADCNLQINKTEGKHDFRFYNTVKKDDLNKDKSGNSKASNATDKGDLKSPIADDTVMKEASTRQNDLDVDDTETIIEINISDNRKDNENQPNNQGADKTTIGKVEKTIGNQVKGKYLNKHDEEEDDYYEVTIDK